MTGKREVALDDLRAGIIRCNSLGALEDALGVVVERHVSAGGNGLDVSGAEVLEARPVAGVAAHGILQSRDARLRGIPALRGSGACVTRAVVRDHAAGGDADRESHEHEQSSATDPADRARRNFGRAKSVALTAVLLVRLSVGTGGR